MGREKRQNRSSTSHTGSSAGGQVWEQVCVTLGGVEGWARAGPAPGPTGARPCRPAQTPRQSQVTELERCIRSDHVILQRKVTLEVSQPWTEPGAPGSSLSTPPHPLQVSEPLSGTGLTSKLVQARSVGPYFLTVSAVHLSSFILLLVNKQETAPEV